MGSSHGQVNKQYDIVHLASQLVTSTRFPFYQKNRDSALRIPSLRHNNNPHSPGFQTFVYEQVLYHVRSTSPGQPPAIENSVLSASKILQPQTYRSTCVKDANHLAD